MSENARSTTVADLRQWTNDARVPGQPPELSDLSCLLIASAYLTPTARATVVRRASSNLPLPSPANGYSELRRVQRSILHAEGYLGTTVLPGLVLPIVRSRLAGLNRRREDAHRAVVTAKGVLPSGTRAIRRERRENTYLEIDEREQLFSGLLCTPVPNRPVGARKAGSDMFDKIVGAVGQVGGRGPRRQMEEMAAKVFGPDAVASGTLARGAAFADGYETLLFVAGHYYDRIRTNPAWLSDHFEMQRVQVNLHAELAEIAADIVALRALRVDLDQAKRNGGFDAGFAEHIAARENALRPVWSELIDRVHALSEIAATVESAAVELRLLDEFDRASTIDARIDHLLARSGDREIGADHTRRLSQQVRSGEEQLRVYRDVLQGNISQLGPGLMRELPERYEP
ncbi:MULTISPECIES: hypothetical protein [Gordonia]|jgi:hypothetical protein|uniref:Uncharacterized protein n=1 Tax=Gordonia malaquae NBRC 108250 TaxID=1223542 RepID=M3UV37_GORML|nr:hypothetical protein [Gordonia malaquae]GAC79367.1 hypothetical protein GM1_008_01290 [Gordonia malaquae NBRC 108250]SEE31186.1 hypothetical protein SAMN04488550_4271 [Gordonia malaquae]